MTASLSSAWRLAATLAALALLTAPSGCGCTCEDSWTDGVRCSEVRCVSTNDELQAAGVIVERHEDSPWAVQCGAPSP